MKALIVALLLTTCITVRAESLLKLVMMVKNEAETIKATLETTAPYIDAWLILDTGSTDGTQQIVTDFFGGKQIPGRLVEQPFVDFSTSRNYALEQAGTDATWLLLLDADDYTRDAATLRSTLKRLAPSAHNCLMTSWRWSNTFQVIKIIRSKTGLRFGGRVHEALPHSNCASGPFAFYIEHTTTETSSASSRKRWERDVGLLHLDLVEYAPSEHQHRRSTYYLAKTYDWLGQQDKAYEYYEKRTKLGGWDEEIYQSYMHMAHLSNETAKRLELFATAATINPDRAEPWYWSALVYDEAKDWQQCYYYLKKASALPKPNRMLDVSDTMYTLNIPLMMSRCAYNAERYKEAMVAVQRALEQHPTNDRVLNNYRLLVEKEKIAAPQPSGEGKTICFYVGYSDKPWSPETYKQSSLGGSETAAMWLAAALAKRGHSVTVVGGVVPGLYTTGNGSVYYVSLSEAEAFFKDAVFDVMIVSRYVHFFLQYAPTAAKTYIWSHDVELLSWWSGHKLPLQTYLKNLWPTVTGLVALNNWHRHLLQDTYPFITNETAFAIGNGLNVAFFEEAGEVKRDPYRLIWSSAPNRGLDRLLKLIPALKAKLPKLTLHIFAHEAAQFDNNLKELVDSLKGTVIWRGPVPQKQLAKEILASSVWLYPTHFRESYPITALEMMAGGVIPIVVPYAGLYDVVKGKGVILKVPGFTTDKATKAETDSDYAALVNGMNQPTFAEGAVDAVVRLVKARRLDERRMRLIRWARSLSWDKRAQEWEELFAQS